MPPWPRDLLAQVSQWTTPVIAGVGLVHFLAFLWLWAWARRDLRRLAHDFDSFTRDLKHRSLFARGTQLSDQLDAFLADVKEVLDDPRRQSDRQALHQRMTILDEERRYLQSQSFDTCYNVCRTMIEAYPLAGVLGTILAIGAALQVTAVDEGNTVQTIVRYFGDAIWSTFAGLIAAMWLMFVNSLVEPGFRRLSESRVQVRDTVIRAKRELSLRSTGEPSA
ncbi:MotA/TolQ/ExbB proton channel [bacterium]|nr:MotA/TolQ/ExbB proton channel [bacterium]